MKEFKSGFVTVIGRTNVGKSSIINKIVGEKVSAVTNKSQTTRKNIKAILNTNHSQIIFTDTPGIHKPKSLLSTIMNDSAMLSIPDVDIVVYVIDATSRRVDDKTIDKIKNAKKPTILVINKIDLVKKEQVAEIINAYKDLYDFSAIIPISVKQDKNIDELVKEIESNLKVGPAYYDVEEYTNQSIREIIEEIIREKALKLLKEEVPHGIYVEVTSLKTRKTQNNEKIFDIDSTIFCLREGHKGIIIGKNGEMLKKIGSFARKDIENILQSKVNLKIWVKVQEDWINNSEFVKRFKTND